MSSSHSVSFLLLPTSAMPSADDFHRAWREMLGDVGVPTVSRWDEETAVVAVDGVTTIASLTPAPVPNREAEQAASRSLSAFRTGGFSPAPHVAHLVVVSSSPTEPHVQRLLRHARVVAGLAKACHATGVYEGGAHATHDVDFYASAVADPAQLPLVLWNGVSIARAGSRVEILTLGMAQLELPDLLLVSPAARGNEALSFAFDLLDYIASRGSPLSEGESVGRSEAEKLPVSYVPSPLDASKRVMRIEIGA